MTWLWNGEVDESGITLQLNYFKSQHLEEVVISYQQGCTFPYMSPRHMELMQYAASEAKRLGMRIWIQDKFRVSNGKNDYLYSLYPQCSQKKLTCISNILNAQAMRSSFCMKGKFLYAQSIKEKKGNYYIEDVKAGCEVSQGDQFVKLEYQNTYAVDEYILFYFITSDEMDTPEKTVLSRTKGASLNFNLLNKETVKSFLQHVFERYKAHLGEYFGTTVAGVLVEEPTMYKYEGGPHPGAWEDDLLMSFEKEYGYSLLPYLYALFYEPKTKEEAKARADYQAVLKQMYEDNFLKQMKTWCHENGLLLAIQPSEANLLEGQIAQGDMLCTFIQTDIPIVDVTIGRDDTEVKKLSIKGKLATSAGKFAGAKDVALKVWTEKGKTPDFHEMQRVINQATILGVTKILYGDGHYSMRGGRKTENLFHTVGYCNPEAEAYTAFNKYIAGLRAITKDTCSVSKVLIFNPLAQALQELNTRDGGRQKGMIPSQAIYEQTIDAFLRAGVGFDLCSEDMIKHMHIGDGFVELYGFAYECVLLPGMRLMSPELEELLQQLKEHQIKVIEHCNVKEMFPCALDLDTQAKVYVSERMCDRYKVYYIANDENAKVEATVKAMQGMKIYNVTTWQMAEYPVVNGRVQLTLKPYEMVVAVCEYSDEPYTSNAEAFTQSSEMVLQNEFVFEAEGGNILPMTVCEVYDKEIADWMEAEEYLQFPQGMYLEQNEVYQVRGTITFDYIPQQVYVHAEKEVVARMCVNGKEVQLSEEAQYVGVAGLRCDVTKLLHIGKNSIEIEAITEKVHVPAMTPLIFFTGNFAVNRYNKAVLPTGCIHYGDWSKQGYPYYAGRGIYKSARTDCYGMGQNSSYKPWKKAVLKVQTDRVISVYVNGQYAGTNVLNAGEIDVTDKLANCYNDITLVISAGYENLFGKVVPNGLTEPVKIQYYR